MTARASGPFEVKLIPQAPDEQSADATIGRMLIDKQFHGDLEAHSIDGFGSQPRGVLKWMLVPKLVQFTSPR